MQNKKQLTIFFQRLQCEKLDKVDFSRKMIKFVWKPNPGIFPKPINNPK